MRKVFCDVCKSEATNWDTLSYCGSCFEICRECTSVMTNAITSLFVGKTEPTTEESSVTQVVAIELPTKEEIDATLIVDNKDYEATVEVAPVSIMDMFETPKPESVAELFDKDNEDHKKLLAKELKKLYTECSFKETKWKDLGKSISEKLHGQGFEKFSARIMAAASASIGGF